MSRARERVFLDGRAACSIHIGGVVASWRPIAIRTVLGSCVAVCLFDPLTQVGGMNHFMLPSGGAGDGPNSRYGVHAMELLINACMKAGADRRMLEAKVFGGGHVLKMRRTDGDVPRSNIDFAMSFLATENIPVVSSDLGGYAAREVFFLTDTGKALVKRLSETGRDASQTLADLEREEREQLRQWANYRAHAGDATLFTEEMRNGTEDHPGTRRRR